MDAIRAILLASLLCGNAIAFDYIDATDPDNLVFPTDTNGNAILDYSYAGYKYRGRDAIPDTPANGGTKYAVQATVAALSTGSNDTAALNNTNAIQAAIDTVEALSLNQHGFRGAVDFTDTSGAFYIDDETAITIEASGVVLLLGDVELINYGDTGSPNQQIIIGPSGFDATVDKWEQFEEGDHHAVISGDEDPLTGISSDFLITDTVVEAGSFDFTIGDASSFSVGDMIIVKQPQTDDLKTAWNYDGGTSPTSPPADNTGDDWPHNDDYEFGSGAIQGPVHLVCWKQITAIDGNTITVDTPFMLKMTKADSQAYVFEWTANYIENVGIEAGRLDLSRYWNDDPQHNTDDLQTPASTDDYPARQSSKGIGIGIYYTQNVWIRDTIIENHRNSGTSWQLSRHGSQINVQTINPHGVIEASNLYGTNTSGAQFMFFEDCYSSYHRHNFISNGWAADHGHVLYSSTSDNSYGTAIEYGHQKATHGCLIDSVLVTRTHGGDPPFNVGADGYKSPSSPSTGGPYTTDNFDDRLLWSGHHQWNSTMHGNASMNILHWNITINTDLNANHFILVQNSAPAQGPNWYYQINGSVEDDHSLEGMGGTDHPNTIADADNGLTGSASDLPPSIYEYQLTKRLGGSGDVVVSGSVTGSTLGIGQ